MRSTVLARTLARLMPMDTRRELFEPALMDLFAEAARTGRSTTIPTVILFLQCWRLAPAEVFLMIVHDIRQALRLLIREPGFTCAAVLTLALGIGANVSVFTIVNAALLRPLPYPDADRLVLLEHRDRRTGFAKQFVAMGDFVDLRARQQSFESIAAYGAGPQTVFDAGEPFDVLVLHASPDLLDLLRARPAIGRAFSVDDGRPGAAPVVILAYDVWEQHFGSRPDLVGRTIKFGDTPRQVIGIMPRGFRFPANHRTGAIIPMPVPVQAPAGRKSGWVFAAARLGPGVTVEQAQADLTALSRQMEAEFPADNQGSEYFARSLRDMMIGDTRPALLLLLAAVGVVLLIACVNVANLLVARAMGRRQETAVRVALVNPSRVSASTSSRRAATGLVVVETALAIVLLTGAGLVLRSFARLVAVDPGFSADRVLIVPLMLPQARYQEAAAREAFYQRAFDAIRGLSGVESLGSAAVVPLTGNNWTVPFDRADRPVPSGQRAPDVGWQAADAGFFTTLRIPLREGRLFAATDRRGGPPVVIISEAIRERFFPGESPIGRRILNPDGGAEIVGVVGSIRRAALTDAPRADLYFPAEQGRPIGTTLFIRTAGEPEATAGAVRVALRGIEPMIVIPGVRTMGEIARQSVQVTSLALWLLGLFALIALSLASVGIYGVMSYAVRQRTREIGTRLALGATPSNILWMVMRDGLFSAGLGAAIGLAAGFGVSRQMRPLLFATPPGDPIAMAGAAVLLMLVALTACYIPARRATRTDPRESLIPDR